MRWLKRLAVLLGVIAVFIGLGASVPRPLFSPTDNEPRTRRIFLLSNPIHTDIAVPIDASLLEAFTFLKSDGLPVELPNARYLVFG